MIATTALSPQALNRAAAVIRCLGHPLRLRLLEALESAGPFAYYWIVEPKVKSVLDCIRAGECGNASAPPPGGRRQ